MLTTVLVWLLMVSDHNGDGTKVVAKFKDQNQCEHVLKNIPGREDHTFHAKCVQANIAKEW
jgi:hypothetical protein